MVTGTSLKVSEEARDLAKQFPNFLYFTAGVFIIVFEGFSFCSLEYCN